MQTVDPLEIERFSRIAEEWWDPHGKFAPLHRMNPTRIAYIRDTILQHRGAEDRGSEVSENDFLPNPQSLLTGLTLLDIGCGGGLIAEPMARLGASVTGIDAGEKNIAVAELHATQAGLEIDYRCTSAEALLESRIAHHEPLYDIVLALEIIEHVADIAAFTHCAVQLAKPGGLVIFSTLNRTVKSYAMAILGAEYILRWLPVGTHDWNKFLKPHELVRHLEQAGGAIKEMTGMVMHPLTQAWRLDAKDLGVNYLVVAEKIPPSSSGLTRGSSSVLADA